MTASALNAAAIQRLTTTIDLPLHGPWRRSVGGVAIDEVAVPGGFLPMGTCTLERDFVLPAGFGRDQRCFLRTEGVLAWADLSLNGTVIGTASPWSRCRFELPAGLLRERNTLTAVIRDIGESFGPTPGRHFEAGLIRPIGIEVRPRTHLADIHAVCTLSDDLRTGTAVVGVEFDGAERLQVTAVLRERLDGQRPGREVARATGPAGAQLALTVAEVRPWSPETPFLYDLTVTAGADSLSEAIGFRRIEVAGRDFRINGRRLILKGVCRHEFMSGHGYAAPEEAVRRELHEIRAAGFNHVRLVHSPQAAWVPRIAAEVGILISEEPGTCFHDLADPRVADPAIDALRVLVKRDRNVPSILAWYIYNECLPNIPFAKRAVEACAELDPGRLTAMADCSGRIEEVRAMVAEAGLSFYGINLYTFWTPDYRKTMDAYADRPLVFTEWGACLVQGNERLFRWHLAAFLDATRTDATQRIAGFSYWVWGDYPEHSRTGFAAIDGWTVEGLVDLNRKEKPDLALLTQWCRDVDHPPEPAVPEVQVLLRTLPRPGAFHTVDLGAVAGDQGAAEAAVLAARQRIEAFPHRVPSIERVHVAGIPFAGRGGAGPLSPLLLNRDRTEARIAVGRPATGISILGHIAFTGGYPSNSVHSVHHKDQEPDCPLGRLAGSYELVFDDGVETVELRHGINVLRANDICRWWVTAPRAPQTVPALRTVIHPSYDILRIDLWQREWAEPRTLLEIRWKLADLDAVLGMAALTVHGV